MDDVRRIRIATPHSRRENVTLCFAEKMFLKYLAMISDFNVKRVAVAIDITLVEGIGPRELPRTYGVDALQHGIE